jgi:hypothetical protein
LVFLVEQADIILAYWISPRRQQMVPFRGIAQVALVSLFSKLKK